MHRNFDLDRAMIEELPKIRRALDKIAKLLEEESNYRKAFDPPREDRPYDE